MLSVTRDKDGKSGFVSIAIKLIVYLEYDRLINKILVHTKDDVYYTMGTLKYFVEALNNSGYHFLLVDRGNAVHLDNVKGLDRAFKAAYFDDEIRINSKRCTIATPHFNDFINALKITNPGIIGL